MFQKKKVESVPEPLTEKEIQKIKDKLNEKEDLSDLKIKDLKIEELFPQFVNNVTVTIENGRQTLYLPEGMDKGKFKTFRKSKGGMFAKDVMNFGRGNEHGKYVLIEGKGERKIVRLIEDEELFLFQTFKLVSGIIKDKPFMLLKNLQDGQNYTSSGRYIEKINSEELENEETMNVNPQVTAELEDDHDSTGSSVSLFDE